MYIVMVIYTTVTYPGQKVTDTIKIGGRFLYPIFAVALLGIFERDKGPEKFMKLLNFFAVIWSILTIIQSFYYARTGGTLFAFREYFYSDINTKFATLQRLMEASGVSVETTETTENAYSGFGSVGSGN